jgi:hypothetical protein
MAAGQGRLKPHTLVDVTVFDSGPHATLVAMRKAAPVHEMPFGPNATGWLISRYEDPGRASKPGQDGQALPSARWLGAGWQATRWEAPTLKKLGHIRLATSSSANWRCHQHDDTRSRQSRVDMQPQNANWIPCGEHDGAEALIAGRVPGMDGHQRSCVVRSSCVRGGASTASS